ncbi:MAG TPA: formate dehydrogenase accessory sulfurtransferase FdhD [Verrucomicrobiales bacterium]|nr:formate dehydrogenase accessory sulfurtransferase FdhD [Verrucomicrobiales bacterium]
MNPGLRALSVQRFVQGVLRPETPDDVTVEEPLEIRVEGQSVAVTMRTPGHDAELAVGFLVTEGIIRSSDDIFELTTCPSTHPDAVSGNVVDVLLRRGLSVDFERLSRHVFTSSSCGLCGKATIDNVLQRHPPVDSPWRIDPAVLLTLPPTLRQAQATFRRTGGLHASGLFDAKGNLLALREDVGRHNALDKLIGRACLDGRLPLSQYLVLVSGRISFELAQKALVAGVPALAGISAPSTLAIDCALRGNQFLAGFLREETFNVYAHPERLSNQEP